MAPSFHFQHGSFRHCDTFLYVASGTLTFLQSSHSWHSTGPELLALSLGTTQFCYNLHQIIDHTTTLRSLVFDGVDFSSLCPPALHIYPTITHIGIAGSRYFQRADISNVQRGLANTLPDKHFPNLKTIRFLAEDVPLAVGRAWKPVMEMAAQYGIQMEDRHRRRLRHNDP